MEGSITFAASALRLAGRGWRPFPGFQKTKIPAMKGWPGLNCGEWDDEDLLATITEYRPEEAYCCCLAVQSEIVVLDLDLEDTIAAAFASKLREDLLGKTPLIRIGFAPKHVAIYRNGGGIRSRKLNPLEIFSGSGQFVGFGWHQRAGKPYEWPCASPLDVRPTSAEIPLVSEQQLTEFQQQLFKVVPRRSFVKENTRAYHGSDFQTIGDRLRSLKIQYGSWTYAAKIVLREAAEGSRNETAWIVVASAVGHGIPDEKIWDLFENHFSGWAGYSSHELTSAIFRARKASEKRCRF